MCIATALEPGNHPGTNLEVLLRSSTNYVRAGELSLLPRHVETVEVQTFRRELCSTRANRITQVNTGAMKFKIDGMRRRIFNTSQQCSVVAFPVAIYACCRFRTIDAYFRPLSLKPTTLSPLRHRLPKPSQALPCALTP